MQALKTEAAAAMPWAGRVLLLVLNFVPMLLVGGAVFIILFAHASLAARIGISVAYLYLFPAVAGRLILLAAKIPEGQIRIGSRSFFAWWSVFQFQVLFCRIPTLEEVVRLIPGLYSQWLRLWGSRIGRFTYWSPGTLITDRSFLSIGDDVVFGAGVRLNAHVMAPDKTGRMQLILARVTVGDRAMVGGYCLLTSGTEIAADERPPACILLPPFSLWQNGRRIKRQQTADLE